MYSLFPHHWKPLVTSWCLAKCASKLARNRSICLLHKPRPNCRLGYCQKLMLIEGYCQWSMTFWSMLSCCSAKSTPQCYSHVIEGIPKYCKLQVQFKLKRCYANSKTELFSVWGIMWKVLTYSFLQSFPFSCFPSGNFALFAMSFVDPSFY